MTAIPLRACRIPRPTGDVGEAMRLGLAVCHPIVTIHGGIITAESEVDGGSTFRVDLPAAPLEACRPP
jgi:signal transduction histidine kinase